MLFLGCSLQDPRILDWIAGLTDAAAEGLKEWRAVMTESEWQRALAFVHDGVPAMNILARAPMRPLIMGDHEEARSLLVDAAVERSRAADFVELEMEIAGGNLSARMAGAGSWAPSNPLDDAGFVDALRALRELGHRSLPTDEQGQLAPAFASQATSLRSFAADVGRAVTGILSSEAQR